MHSLIGFGPANYAGQAHAWAEAVRAHEGVPSTSFTFRPLPRGLARTTTFGFESDHLLPNPRLPLPGSARRAERYLNTLSHLFLDGFVNPFRGPGGELSEVISRRDSQGLFTALIAHGTELRSPDLHRQNNDWSYFAHVDDEWLAAVRAGVARTQAILATHPGTPLLVSTPDLLQDAPDATWLPLALPPRRPRLPATPGSPRPGPKDGRLRVLHVPSRRRPAIKGTEFVDPVLHRLDAEGMVDYVSPEWVPHDEMDGLMASCDVVIDQLLTGSYGVTALEAMRAGCVVIGNLNDFVRAQVDVPVPIVDANPETLREVVLSLRDRTRLTDLRDAGHRFVKEVHDGRRSAKVITECADLAR
ncbi:glycosyltransferase [Nocardioides sp. Y6]|uniref:Glycosyltransferase n=1 Tax=Nocardioides malaquae TaxID=2773426 RepID=A0ABR9RTC8_9ACTN|nr:glycosyltransferase [Nocardioides malaquae]MBE7324829.1 glycosyltransferase [Nocardioides malaquae]